MDSTVGVEEHRLDHRGGSVYSLFHLIIGGIPVLESKVRAELESIRPMLQADGGDIELVSVSEDGVVSVSLRGACGSCPMATMTLKWTVEKKLKEAVPGVVEVVQV